MNSITVIFQSLSVMTVILQSIVVSFILVKKKLRKHRSNRLISNISISYIFLEITTIIVQSKRRRIDNQSFLVCLSFVIIVCYFSLSIDRYIFVKHPETYHSSSRFTNFVLISFGWLCGMFLLCLTLLSETYFRYKESKHMKLYKVLTIFILSQLLWIFNFIILLLFRKHVGNNLEQIESLAWTQWQVTPIDNNNSINVKTTSQNVIYDAIIQTPICFNAVIVFTVLLFPWQLNCVLRITRENDVATWFDVFSTGFVRINSLLYPILVIKYHKKLRRVLAMYIPSCHCELR